MQNARFSTARRGYDRDEVDRYMSRVNTLLAELQITAAPEYAIKAAIDQVQDERRSVITEAKQEAEQLREAAAQEANGTLAGAETRILALQAHVEEMQERRDLAVEELVELSRSLDELLEQNGANGMPSPAPDQEAARAT